MNKINIRKNWLDWIVLSTVVWCIFSYKFVLIEYQGTGIRIDDFLILFLLSLFIVIGFIFKIKLPQQLMPFIIYLCVAILSSLYNGAIGRVSTAAALVFSIRSIEYFSFFYIGIYMARRKIDLYPIFRYYLFFLLILVPLQMANLVPVASSFDSTRAIGNTYGPYELAVLSAFLSFYFYFYTPKHKFNALSSFFILIATASRTTSFAYLLIIANRYRKKLIYAIPFIIIGGVFMLSLNSGSNKETGGDDLVSRIAMLFSPDLLDSLLDASSNISPVSSSQEYINTYFLNVMDDIQYISGDASAYIRFYRWIALIKSSFAHFDSIFIGLGPSFGTSSVDGFYVRILIETGVIGLGLYIWFIARCIKNVTNNSLTFRYYVVVMAITAFTIDIFFSYKPMLIFWLYLGWLHEHGKISIALDRQREPTLTEIPQATPITVAARRR